MSKMTIKALFIQRTEHYEGQHAPELLDAVDEYTDDENPSYFDEKIEQAEECVKNGSYAGLAIVKIKVDQDKIRELCLGRDREIDGEVEVDD